jgi:hypothetical protein
MGTRNLRLDALAHGIHEFQRNVQYVPTAKMISNQVAIVSISIILRRVSRLPVAVALPTYALFVQS